MQITAGQMASFFGRAMFSFRCWPSGLAYSIPSSNAISAAQAGFVAASANIAARHNNNLCILRSNFIAATYVLELNVRIYPAILAGGGDRCLSRVLREECWCRWLAV